MDKNEKIGGGFNKVFAVSIGLFLVFLDSTVVNIALPTIMDEYDIGLDTAAWIINSFAITLAVSLVIFSKLADIFGRLNVFIVGLTIFTISSFMCGIAANEAFLIISRVIQAIGGAMIIPSSMMLVRQAVPPEKVGTAMGIWGGVGALAMAVGPSIGGVVTEAIKWNWVFYINIPIILFTFPYIFYAFKGHKDNKIKMSISFFSVLLLSLAVFFLTYAILNGDSIGWNSKKILFYFAISILSAILFFFLEKRTKSPLINYPIFKNKFYLGGILSNVLSGIIFMGVLILLPSFFVEAKGYSTLEASFLISPFSIIILVVAPVVGKLIDKVGYLIPMICGYIFVLLGLSLFTRITVDTEIKTLILYMSFIGLGLGMMMVTSVTICTASIPEKYISLGSGVFATTRSIGGAVGVALFVSITSTSLNAYSKDSLNNSIERYKQAQIPQYIKEKTIGDLKKKEWGFEKDRVEEKNKDSTDIKKEIVKNTELEVLSRLDGTPLSLEKKKEIEITASKELKRIELIMKDIRDDIKKDRNSHITKAMTNSYFSGIILTILFSTSIFFLKRKQSNRV